MKKAYIYKPPLKREIQGVGENAQDFFYHNIPYAYVRDEKYLECLGDVNIKPCHFCGSDNIEVKGKWECVEQAWGLTYIHFICRNCKTDVKIPGNRLYDAFNVKEAIDFWNKRGEK